jgi:hypothetical protein
MRNLILSIVILAAGWLSSACREQATTAPKPGPVIRAELSPVAPSGTFLAAPDLDAAVLTSTVIEGSAIKLALVNPSPAGGTFTYAFDCGSGSGFGPFGSNNRAACPTVDNGLRTVRGEIRDANGTVTAYATVVTIVNQKPHVVLTTAQGSTSTLGSPRTVSGTFTDPGMLDAPWVWVVQWGDGSSSNGSSSTQGGAIPASHAYTSAGTFKISMTVTDKDGGTGKSNSVSVQVISSAFMTLSAGGGHTCGVTTSGTAYCWGDNFSGDVGDGDLSQHASPVPVSGGLTFAAVSAAAGGGFTCGVTTGGAAYCWGSNVSGGLGDGTTTNRSNPVAVLGGLSFVAVSVGLFHACGVTPGGAAYCWGYNNAGQLGDGTRTDRTSPTLVLGGLKFAKVSAGGGHTCGVTTEGAVYCWGLNAFGELGDGTTTDRLTPVHVALP